MKTQAKIDLPPFFRVRQGFQSHRLDDVAASVSAQLDRARVADEIQKGDSIAIAVGSRGISNIGLITKTVVRFLANLGGRPFIVPAMGSHGGATPEGQASVLATYGIDSANLGCEIRSNLDTAEIGSTRDGTRVHFDKHAAKADHIIIVNRIKPHTRLVGPIQSGVCKMMMIGLGKHRGALQYHQVFPKFDYEFAKIAKQAVPLINRQMPIRLGIAIVEDAFDNTCHVEAIQPQALLAREPELLQMAIQHMPSLPFDHADLLIVDQIGKEISGTGMDTNIVGRKQNDREAAPNELPKIKQIYVRSLTSKTKGNATGIGIAEYCHSRIPTEMDYDATRVNCVTSGHVSAGAIPVHFGSDIEVFGAAINQATDPSPGGAQWMRIRDTLHLNEMDLSLAYFEDAQSRSDLEIIASPAELRFDDQGDLVD